jgi:hypothetical protein
MKQTYLGWATIFTMHEHIIKKKYNNRKTNQLKLFHSGEWGRMRAYTDVKLMLASQFEREAGHFATSETSKIYRRWTIKNVVAELIVKNI